VLIPLASQDILPHSTELLVDENDTTRQSLPCLIAAVTEATTTAFDNISRLPDMLCDVSKHIISGPPAADGSCLLRRWRRGDNVGMSTQPESS
jgi:hypothetical protein